MKPTPGTKEYRQAHLKEMQAWPLDKKINHALKRILEFYLATEGKVYIAFSGGKDSCVLRHLCLSVLPEATPVVFSNTTNEYAEIIRHVKETDNVIWLKPKMTFEETVAKYGFPLVSKEVAQKIYEIKTTKSEYLLKKRLYGDDKGNGKVPEKWKFLALEAFNLTHKCCYFLKKEPFLRYEKETGRNGYIGTRIEESRLRRTSWIEKGCNTFKENHNKSRPLSLWTTDDIHEYCARFNVPLSNIYSDIINGAAPEEGTGCEFCGFGEHLNYQDTNKLERSYLRKPKRFAKMMKLENNGVTFREALIKVGVRLPPEATE